MKRSRRTTLCGEFQRPVLSVSPSGLQTPYHVASALAMEIGICIYGTLHGRMAVSFCEHSVYGAVKV